MFTHKLNTDVNFRSKLTIIVIIIMRVLEVSIPLYSSASDDFSISSVGRGR